MNNIDQYSDITVEEIIATFKCVKREKIQYSDQVDNFLITLQKKNNWSIEEYKKFIYAYNVEYMHIDVMDHMRINKIARKYQFKLDWNDYFFILDSIENKEKQEKYVNYYLWYHYMQINEQVYQQLMNKPYFNLVLSESKEKFLGHMLSPINNDTWLNKYFTKQQLQAGLEKNMLHICIYEIKNGLQLAGQIDHKKIENIRNFYNNYESIMSSKLKARFFYNVIKNGNKELVYWLYKEKKIIKINKVKLFWHLFSDTTSTNQLEILQLLKEVGLKFQKNDLIKTKKNAQWHYMEGTDILEYFFKMLEKEENYKNLDKNLNNKNKSVIKQKCIKI